jgi:hypothetical protein
MLRARCYTKTAGVALMGIYCVCLPIAVHPSFYSRWKTQRCAIFITQRSHLEDIVRAYAYAILLALAPIPINDRREHVGILFALVYAC